MYNYKLDHAEEKALDGIEWPSKDLNAINEEKRHKHELEQLWLISPRQRWAQLSRCYERVLNDIAYLHNIHYPGQIWNCQLCVN